MTEDKFVTREELQTESRIIRLEEIAANTEKTNKSTNRWARVNLMVVVSILIGLTLLVFDTKTDISDIKSAVAGLRADVNLIRTDVNLLKIDVAVLKTDVAVLKTDVAGLKKDVSVLQEGQDLIFEILQDSKLLPAN